MTRSGISLVTCLSATTLTLGGEFSWTRVAMFGDELPDGNGRLADMWLEPVINDAGQVALAGIFTDTAGGTFDNEGLLFFDGESLSIVARAGDPAPDGNGFYGTILPGTWPVFRPPAMNDDGVIVTMAQFINAGPATDGIIRADGEGVTQVVRLGDATPDGSGQFVQFLGGIEPVSATGGTSFFVDVLTLPESAGGQILRSLWRNNGAANERVMQVGDPVPDGVGNVTEFLEGWSTISATGDVCFKSEVTAPPDDPSSNSALFYATADAITVLERGSFEFAGAARAVMNDDGQTAVSIGRTLRIGDERGLTIAVEELQPVPDGPGRFIWALYPQINDNAEVASLALIDTNGDLSHDETSIIVATENNIRTVVRQGDLLPDGASRVENIGMAQINASGAVAVSITIENAPPFTNAAIYRESNGPPREIIRSDHMLDGHVVANTTATFIQNNGGRKQISDRGEIVMRVYYADGPTGSGGVYVARACATGDLQADLDRDGVVTIGDFESYLDCVSSPEAPAVLGCECVDLDDDGDVDFDDFAEFQRAFEPG